MRSRMSEQDFAFWVNIAANKTMLYIFFNGDRTHNYGVYSQTMCYCAPTVTIIQS